MCVITYIIVMVVHMDHLVVLIIIVGGWTNHINKVGGRPVFSTTISVSVTVTEKKVNKSLYFDGFFDHETVDSWS